MKKKIDNNSSKSSANSKKTEMKSLGASCANDFLDENSVSTQLCEDGLPDAIYIARLKKFYLDEGCSRLMKIFGYKNRMEIPRILKVAVSIGIKEAASDPKFADKCVNELMLITGQRPALTRAKKSIAAFKLRAGDVLGCRVTLRSNIMYEFLDRLVNIALPSVRDFRGFHLTQIDAAANFSFGLKEQIVFPEIVYDKIDKVRGMNITIVTTAKTREEAKALLEVFDFPFYN